MFIKMWSIERYHNNRMFSFTMSCSCGLQDGTCNLDHELSLHTLHPNYDELMLHNIIPIPPNPSYAHVYRSAPNIEPDSDFELDFDYSSCYVSDSSD